MEKSCGNTSFRSSRNIPNLKRENMCRVFIIACSAPTGINPRKFRGFEARHRVQGMCANFMKDMTMPYPSKVKYLAMCGLTAAALLPAAHAWAQAPKEVRLLMGWF